MANEHKSGLGRGLANLLGSNTKADGEKEISAVDKIIDSVNEIDEEKAEETKPAENVSRETQSYINVSEPIVRGTSYTEVKPAATPAATTPTPSVSEVLEKVEAKKTAPFKYQEIDISLIEPNPEQPRSDFNSTKLNELANSINDQGVLQPIVVRKMDNNKYQIVAGERRWQASRIARKTTIPAIVTEFNEDKALEAAVIENIQRDDLNPIEEAYAYKRLMDKMNYTQAELAKAVAKGRSTIANAVRLLDLPEKAQEAMFKNELTAGHARAILSVPSPKGREKLTQKIIDEKLSVRDAEALAKILSMNPADKAKTKKKSLPSEFTAIAKSLSKELNLSIKVKTSKTGNSLVIPFENADDLQKLADKLISE